MSFRCAIASILALIAAAAMAQDSPSSKRAASQAGSQPVSSAGLLFSGDAEAGHAKAGVCGACHGMDGNSSDAQYPKLAGQNVAYTVRQLSNFKRGKRQNAIMLGFAAQLSTQDMYDIAAYFASQKVMPGVADQALVQRGQKLYRGGDPSRNLVACSGCHDPAGGGNPGPGYPQLAGQHADYVQHTLSAWHDGTTWGNDAHAMIMPTIAKRLKRKDIAALSSYIEGLHRSDSAHAGDVAP